MLIGEPLEDSTIAGLKEEMRRYSMLQDYTLNVVQSSAQGMDAAELRNAIELEMSKSNTEIASTDAQNKRVLQRHIILCTHCIMRAGPSPKKAKRK